MPFTHIRSGLQSRRVRLCLRLLFGLGIVIFLLYSVDPASVIAVIYTANPYFILLALALYAATFLILAFRWRFILSRMGYDLPLSLAYQAFAAGVLISDLTPARIGELSRPLAIRDCVPIKNGLVSVLADRYMDILVIFILGSIGILAISSACEIPLIPILTILIILLMVPVLLLIIDKKHLLQIAIWTRSQKLTGLVQSTSEIAGSVRGIYGLATVGISLTFFSWIFQAARIVALCYATGYLVPIRELIVMQPLISALSLIPLSLAGLGLVEGGYAAMLTLFGIPVGTGMAIALLDRAITMAFHLAVGGRKAAEMI